MEAIYRTQYAVEDANAALTAAGKPELEYFDASNTDKYQVDQDGNWSATAANNYMTTNLSQYNESSGNMIEIVICNNDGMAEGVISALNDKGYNLGDGSSTTIPVFGVDATDAAKQLIADGKMTGTIKQDAEGMAGAIAHLTKNVQAGSDLMADTDSYNISPECKQQDLYSLWSIYRRIKGIAKAAAATAAAAFALTGLSWAYPPQESLVGGSMETDSKEDAYGTGSAVTDDGHMQGISRRKGLDHVSLTVKKGTVHALMGENGAGKSTLMKCLFGIYSKDSGSILLEGKK